MAVAQVNHHAAAGLDASSDFASRLLPSGTTAEHVPDHLLTTNTHQHDGGIGDFAEHHCQVLHLVEWGCVGDGMRGIDLSCDAILRDRRPLAEWTKTVRARMR
jgi:hypothetical protein